LRFKLPSAAQSDALKQAIQQRLRTRLGKPKGYGSENSPYWKLVRRIEVSLSEFGAELAGPGSSAGERIVELSISEPSGP
ncbi:MAG TPA: hypothetical protein VJR89_30150, partial [Polyangiales bacterium]|nr:hypothetical protein [Polyangiales bacterium]